MKNLFKVAVMALAFGFMATACNKTAETTETEVTETIDETATDISEGASEVINTDSAAAENATADEDTIVVE